MEKSITHKAHVHTFLYVFFFLISGIEVWAAYKEYSVIEFICKPLITVVLATLYLVLTKKASFFYLSVLLFSFWGDVLLLFPEQFFLVGLVAFLMVHVFLILILKQKITVFRFLTFCKNFPLFAVYFLGIMYLIFPYLNEMFVPVLIYGATISTFGTFALMYYKQSKTKRSLLLLIGALIFIVSDSMIAVSMFHPTNLDLQGLIMLTYIVAQYLIFNAMVLMANKDVVIESIQLKFKKE